MTALELLTRARALGVRLWVDGGRLRYDAPSGTMTEQLREQFAAHRDEIISALDAASTNLPLVATERGGLLPLSFAQQRLWLLEQLEPGTSIYHTYGAVRIHGAIDAAMLERSLSEVVRRHEALRTTFVVVDGVPQQRINPPQPLSIHVEDLRHLPRDERTREAHVRAQRHRGTTFDLTAGPLIRVHLLRLDDAEHVMVVVMHHIVCDGWSVAVLTSELSALYEAFASGRRSPLRELPIQYGDFTAWQRASLQGDRLEAQLSFWRRQLDGVAALELPTKPRPVTASGRGAEVSLVLSAQQEAGLESLSRREGVTLFMTLLAAFDVLLARYARQSDIVVGVPVANRTQPQLEPLIGFFVNMLVMRSDLSGNPTFRELLQRVRTMALDAYAHQDTPFERIVEELQPDRDSGRTPLFQVTFSFQNTPPAALQFGGARLEPMRIDNPTTRFDLELQVSKLERGLVARLNYSTDLFEERDMQAMARAFGVLLDGIVTDAGTRISQLPLLTAADRRTILSASVEDLALPALNGSVASHFEAQVIRTPHAVAVVFNDESLSYAQLNERANRLARHLASVGVRRGSLVGVALDRSLDLIVSLVAILKSGAAYVALDPSYPSERLSFIIDDAGLRVVVTTSSLRSELPESATRWLCLDEHSAAIAAHSPDNLQSDAGPDDLAYVTYTSGSTGIPKGVEVRHRGVLRLLADQSYADLGEDERILQLAPVPFDASTLEIWGALLYGGQCILFPERLPVMATLEATMLRHQVTTLWLTASLFNEVIDKAPGALRRVRHVLTGGEALSVPHVRRALAALPDMAITNGYGPTECTTFTCCGAIDRELPERLASLPIGRAISRTQVYLLDGEHHLVPEGMTGELYVGGDGLARGYLRRPDLTAERFVPDPFSGIPGSRLYRTGDLARRLADGRIDFLGRVDRQIKIRGFRVELGEIEAAVLAFAGVSECAVELRQDDGDKQLVAYVVPHQDAPGLADELTAHLRTRLPSYMVPAFVVLLERLPLTANGKIDRRMLPAPEAVRSERAVIAPRTALEGTIAAIWREVLGLEQVGIRDNFFDLGGHSLLLIRVHGRLTESLKRTVPVVDLFRHPTIESLARELGGETLEAKPLEHARARIARRGASGEPNEAIAVIGMAGRFPGAANVDAFWDNLRNGVESIRFFSDDELEAAGVSASLIADPRYVRARGVLDGVELFDAGFFGYTPREAEVMDPQHRVFLECAWEALERSGYDPARYDGLIGVFAGANLNTYAGNLLSNRDALAAIGGVQSLISVAGDFLPTRVSYKLNLRGPSVNIQTACSTSLVAVQMACRSLSAHDCDMALAGGVSISVPYIRGHMFQEGGIASPDGHCRAFDRASQGTVPGNGAGIVVLKRLADALADGDAIQAVIRGAAINNDGSLKVGFTAPGVDGQAEVVAMAHASAGVDPASISYVEAHGTGTALGDPIEINALTRVFGQGEPNSCAIGSLKTNVGHLDAAAGVSGLIKTVLALEHRELPPSLHFDAPNPKIDFASGPFYVNAQLQPWATTGGRPRRAGISSFGIGGTNAHVVLEEAPAADETAAIGGPQLLVVSARTRAALDAMSANLAGFLQRTPSARLADVAFTLQVGRAEFAHRRAIVAADAADAIAKLAATGAREVSMVAAETSARSTVFMFSGQGSQYPGMAASLYDREPVFRAAVDACADILRPYLDTDLRDAICKPQSESASILDETRVTQPALFVVEYALARLLMHWGIRPDVMIGHSIGEYVAACLAGVLTLDDALRLVAVRGRLMQSMPRGAMLAVALAERDVVPMLSDGLWLAAVNGPGMVVVSGTETAVASFEAALEKRGAGTMRLRTSHAFHSGMMDAALPAFAAEVRRTELKAPVIPYISNVTGTAITAEQATDPDYWVSHLRGTVRFADGLATVLDNPQAVLLEVGPGSSLASLGRKQAGRARANRVMACAADNAKDGQALSAESLLNMVGRLWLSGAPIDWTALHSPAKPRRTVLPTYPFDRQRYWIDALPDASKPARPARITKQPDMAGWFYEPAWTVSSSDEVTRPSPQTVDSCLVLTDDSPAGAAIVDRLRAAGALVTLARRGNEFRASGEDYQIDPSVPGHYDLLIAKFVSGGARLRRVIHLWSLPPVDGANGSLEAAQASGFYSLLFLAQALGRTSLDQPLDIHVVGSQLCAVLAGERPAPEKSTLLGLATVIPQEYPHARCSCIDVEPAELLEERGVADRIVNGLLSDATTPIVAYRGGERWTQGYQAVSLNAAGSTHVRAGGVYLITGGSGGVGLAVARRIAAAGGVKLALLSRRPVPSRETLAGSEHGGEASQLGGLIGAVRALEADGAEVLLLQADVADAGEMRRAFETVAARFGRITGVIHAAGVARGPGFGAIQALSVAECEQQFRPKVRGLQVLSDMAAEFHPEFCVLTSSLSTVLGGLGYAAYAAANSFMNAFAEARSEQAAGQTSWLSIDFDGWDFAAAEGSAATTLAVTAAEGAEVLVRALESGDRSRVVISVGDLHARLHRYVHKAVPADRATTEPAPAKLTAYARPDIGNAYVAPTDEVERTIAATWQELLGIDQVGREDNFFDLGGHSLLLVQAHGLLARRIGREFPVTALFEFPTIAALARHLGGDSGDQPSLAGSVTRSAGSEVAVIGMAGRFPGSRDLDEFWTNLRGGIEAIRLCSDDELRRHGVDEELLAHANYVKAVSAIDDVDMFDASFFGYSPREAELLDPQHRVFLESAWQALEHAGCDPARYQGAIGVFAGARANSYFTNVVSNPEVMRSSGVFQASLGTQGDFLASRVSYKLNLKGPSINVQTSCSTSLVAVHQACRSLLDGECDTALAGGVSIGVPGTAGYLYFEEGILSPDGHCRPFDAAARGTVPASGVGVVVLKRLADALADGDSIYAVVRGTAVNNDGASKVGYTAPSVSGQASVITRAHVVAGVESSAISYVEAHGTGTSLGDPIEIAALNKAFGPPSGPPCAIGSVKSNLGHLDAAAGIAGLLKTVLALYHRELPPSLHFQSPNPKIDFSAGRFQVNAELKPWPGTNAGRLAGVSSFGIGGTNAHAVLQEAPPLAASGPSRPWQVLVMSAKSREALDAASDQVLAFLATSDLPLADVAFTLQTGRASFAHRQAVICRDAADPLGVGARVVRGAAGADASCVFVFSELGAGYPGMTRALYDTESSFRADIDQGCAAAARCGGGDPHAELNGAAPTSPASTAHLSAAAVFVGEYALARLLITWGIEPAAMIGQCSSEYVAACLAGVFSLDDAVTLVVAGAKALEDEAALEDFRGAVTRAKRNPAKRRVVSSVTGTWLTAGQATSVDYWVEQLQAPSRLGDCVHAASSLPRPLLIEVGAGRSLALTAGQPENTGFEVINTLPPASDTTLADAYLIETLGQLWTRGAVVDWRSFSSGERRRRVALPSYPFQRQRYWIERGALTSGGARRSLSKNADVDAWFYVPAWRRSPLSSPTGIMHPDEHWLIFEDAAGIGAALTRLLKREGGTITSVRMGTGFGIAPDGAYIINPDVAADYDALLGRLNARASFPRRIAHLWSVGDASPAGKGTAFDRAQSPSFYSVLSLAQSLLRHGVDDVELSVIGDGWSAIDRQDSPRPEKTPVLSLCTVIPQEHPGIRTRTLEVDGVAPARIETIAENVKRELLIESDGIAVAYRGPQRWVQDYDAAATAGGWDSTIRRNGVYVITGGFGQVGLAIAERLATSAAARLVLVGRTALPDRGQWDDWIAGHRANDRTALQIRAVRRLEDAGSEVMVCTADVADADQLTNAVCAARDRFGAVHGVFHAAGTTGGSSIAGIATLARADCDQQFRPKVQGLYALQRAVAEVSPDFCLLTSSLSSILGGLGFGAYAAANRFMDAFVDAQAVTPVRWISVNFDNWNFDVSAPKSALTELAMTPAEGTHSLERILGTDGLTRVVVSTGDLEARLARYVRRQHKSTTPATLTQHARPETGNEYVAPADGIEQLMASLWQELIGIDKVGRLDDFFDLGGHSLLATRVIAHIKERCGVDLPLKAFFEAPQLAELADRVSALQWAGRGRGEAIAGATDREEVEI